MSKYKNVLCVYPHAKGKPEKKYCPPIGLEYIATAIEDIVDKVTIIDMRFQESLAENLKDDTVDLVCLSLNWDYQWEPTIEIISSLPENVDVIVGGRHATILVEELFKEAPKIDYIIRGDGEETMRELFQGKDINSIEGLSFCKDDGYQHNQSREIKSLDQTKYPNRKLRNVEYQFLYKGVDLGMGIDFISTSRGCPFRCKFCTFTNNPLGQKRPWTSRSARSVVDELKEIDSHFVFVVDDNFAVDIKRVEEICDLIIAEGINKIFAVALRLDIYRHPKTLQKMYDAGFRILSIGIESAQDKTLKSMQKGFDTAKAIKAFEEIRKVNFYLHGYFIIGCLGESEKEMMDIVPFAKELGLDTINLSLLRTERYSPLNDLVAEAKEYHVDENQLIYSDELSVEDLRRIRHTIRKQYYSFGTVARIAWKIISARILRVGYLAKLTWTLVSRGLILR